ncbi:MAG TPA: RNA polymerase sigma factor [Polyangiaceae bacterium]|nr:RNA polymerase sigma factor [Polyangiaceae bacterium]
MAAPTFELNAWLETELLTACVDGDTRAWRELHRRYFPVVVAFLRKLGVRERELEDSTQEVFLQVHKYLPRFRRDSELSTWLYRICITQARSVRRRTHVAESLLRFLSFAPRDLVVSEPSLPEFAERKKIQSALTQLPDAERAAFVLYEMEGLPGKQIALILNCTEASVWRRLHEARKKFQRAIGLEPRPSSGTE